MTVSPWPSRNCISLLWTLLFGEWHSAWLVMKMSMSQFLMYMFTSVIIGGFDLLPYALPSNLARWLSSILTFRSYHTCVYLLLFIESLFYCNLAWCVINWHIKLTSLRHCRSITLCTPMHYQMHYIDCIRLGFEPCSSLHIFFFFL